MSAVVRPEPWPNKHEGFHFEPAISESWVTPAIGAGRCRWGAGPGTPACGRQPVATMMRRYRDRAVPWDYCEHHLYGRWIEDGHVMHWRLVPDEGAV